MVAQYIINKSLLLNFVYAFIKAFYPQKGVRYPTQQRLPPVGGVLSSEC